jgi:hypothetical protein
MRPVHGHYHRRHSSRDGTTKEPKSGECKDEHQDNRKQGERLHHVQDADRAAIAAVTRRGLGGMQDGVPGRAHVVGHPITVAGSRGVDKALARIFTH